MTRTLIKDAILVNEGQSQKGSLIIEDDTIADILPQGTEPQGAFTEVMDADGLYLLPGVIDDHVHFRDPGLTHKADMESESRAAAAGGVTSCMEMPNTKPQTTTLKALDDKFAEAARKSRVNYSFFFGATNNNGELLTQLPAQRVCGIKLFMGSSTGNMLVDNEEVLLKIFSEAPLPIMAHCEDSALIAANTEHYKSLYGDDPDVKYHPAIRSEEACYRSSALAVKLAQRTGARLHIAHVSTARELNLFSSAPLEQKRITAEACISHLYFSDKDYERLGTRIKCNPAIKSEQDRDALRRALTDGRIDVIGTDHAPHLLSEKQGGCLKAASGMPMVQFSLVTMLELADQGVLSMEQVVEKMCHAPARLFDISRRGFLRKGYKADLVLVAPHEPWTVGADNILSKCGWSPLEGHTFQWKVKRTFVNGTTVYANNRVNDNCRGEALSFDR